MKKNRRQKFKEDLKDFKLRNENNKKIIQSLFSEKQLFFIWIFILLFISFLLWLFLYWLIFLIF